VRAVAIVFAVGKVLPMQLSGDPDAPISISVSWLKPE
jgi:hypothetical protein